MGGVKDFGADVTSRDDTVTQPAPTVAARSESTSRTAWVRPTMKDVASRAGVSLKTVSRVVNHEVGVSPELVAKVEAAAAELDYRPDLTASNLRRSDRRTATIGLMIEDVANEFSSAVHAGVEDVARLHQVAVLGASVHEDPQRETDLVRALSSRRVDGLILIPTAGDLSYLGRERDNGLPIVFIDRLAHGISADCVITDNREGAEAAMEHLIALGHERMAFIGGLSVLGTAAARYEGYVSTMERHSLVINPDWVVRDVKGADDAEKAVSSMFVDAASPTAIFAAQNMLTMGAVRALKAAELQHRIALVGFDDFALADLLDPPVAVVAQDPRRMGQLAAELLFDRIRNGGVSAEVHTVPSRLVIRRSGEIRPA
jgi:LacI family transcriptional regulator